MPPAATTPAPWPPPGLDLLASDELLMRQALAAFAASAAAGMLALRLPQRLGAALPRGEGHFHLTPELFLQVSGWTRFRFPQGSLLLRAGQALVVPPQLRHAERVGADGRAAGQAFCNLVIRAEDGQFTCHLAREQRGPGAAAGLPAIAHLQARTSLLAPRLHDWLCDATAAGAGADAGTGAATAGAAADGAADAASDASGAAAPSWPLVQARALLAAALAGVLRALDDRPQAGSPPHAPPLLARLQVLIQNQLGDQALGVARLAQQSGCSADHLSRLYRRTHGEPLLAQIQRLRLDRAERLLRDTSLSVKEVAWACGFASAGYFIRQFRARSGRTPGQWREGA